MFILCVMWEACAVVVQLLALQEGSAVGWITKESPINLWQGRVFCHLQSIQTTSEARAAFHSGQTQGKGLGQEANLLNLSSARV
jgi:hypothetical protein